MAEVRKLSVIAREISVKWANPSVHALPYLSAMTQVHTLQDKFYADDARSIVLYFLSNAGRWTGEDARRIKKELNEMLKAE